MSNELVKRGSRELINTQRLIIIAVAVLSLLMGTIIVKVNPLFPIGLIVGLVVVMLIFKYDYFGLLLYFAVFMTRPGETYPSLAPLRIEFLLGGSIAFLTLIKNKYRYGQFSIPNSRLNLDFVLFLGAIALSFFLSSCKTCTVDRFEEMAKMGIFYFLIILIVNSQRRLEIFFWAFIILIGNMAIDVIKGFYGGDAVYNQGLMRATSENSAADNFNGIAITLNTAFPFVYFLFVHYRRLWQKIFFGSVMFLFVWTLLLTGSRGGLIGFVAILGCIWWMSRHKSILLVTFLIFATAIWLGMGGARRERYLSIFDSHLDASSQGRVNAWKDGISLFLDRPITGVGASGFLQARVDKFGVYLDPHNLYVHVFAELGIVGGFIFFFMFLRDIFRLNMKVIRQVKSRGSPHALLVPFSKATIIA